jgi:transposase
MRETEKLSFRQISKKVKASAATVYKLLEKSGA